MNSWKQLPNATRIYLVILVYLVLLLCGLAIVREMRNSPEGFSLGKVFNRDKGQPELTLTAQTAAGPTETISPDAAWLRAKTNVQVLEGPGEGYPGIAWLEDGQHAEIIGVSTKRDWWAIRVPYFASGRGWVDATQVEVNNTADVPVVGLEEGPTAGRTTPENLPVVKAIANLNVRSGPDLRYQKIATLEIDSNAEIVGVSADGFWWLIKVPGTENLQGWISSDYVIAQNADDVPVVGSQSGFQSTLGPGSAFLTAAATVNVRAGPDVTFAVVGQLEPGELAEIVGKTEDGIWWAINFQGAENNQGWVAAAYVEAQNTQNVAVIK